jgi:hypothetical protein
VKEELDRGEKPISLILMGLWGYHILDGMYQTINAPESILIGHFTEVVLSNFQGSMISRKAENCVKHTELLVCQRQNV